MSAETVTSLDAPAVGKQGAIGMPAHHNWIFAGLLLIGLSCRSCSTRSS